MTDPTLKKQFKGHMKEVTGIVFNPTKTEIASCSSDNSAIKWNFEQSLRCIKFEAHTDVINDIAWSPDGSIVVTASNDKTVCIWNMGFVHGNSDVFCVDTSAVRSVDFSSYGQELITASDDKSIKLWEVSQRNFLSSFTGHTNWVRCVRFAPNDTLIASCAQDKTVKLFDPRITGCIHTFADQNGWGKKVAWYPDSSFVAVGLNTNFVKIYDIKMRKLFQSYYNKGCINALDIHPSGNYIIVACNDDNLKIFDLLERCQRYTIPGHDGPVTAVKFSKDGQHFASGGADSHIMLWKTNFDKDLSSSSVESSHKVVQVPRKSDNYNLSDCIEENVRFATKRKVEKFDETSVDDENYLARFVQENLYNFPRITKVKMDAMMRDGQFIREYDTTHPINELLTEAEIPRRSHPLAHQVAYGLFGDQAIEYAQSEQNQVFEATGQMAHEFTLGVASHLYYVGQSHYGPDRFHDHYSNISSLSSKVKNTTYKQCSTLMRHYYPMVHHNYNDHVAIYASEIPFVNLECIPTYYAKNRENSINKWIQFLLKQKRHLPQYANIWNPLSIYENPTKGGILRYQRIISSLHRHDLTPGYLSQSCGLVDLSDLAQNIVNDYYTRVFPH